MDNSAANLIARIDFTLASARLSTWQQQFLTDMRARLSRYGDNTRLTDKQRRKLEEIVGSGTPMKVIQLPPRPRQVSYPAPARRRPYRRYGYSFGRWWTRRLFRDFAIIAVLLVLGAGGMLQNALWSPPEIDMSKTYATTPSQPRFSVTDGDTIRVDGDPKGTRLVGFNTPEVFSPQCQREGELGAKASARMKEIVSSSKLSLTKVACSCRPGTEGTDQCNHGRSCGILRADGRNVGDILISEGLAVPFVCGASGCPPTPRPWCG